MTAVDNLVITTTLNPFRNNFFENCIKLLINSSTSSTHPDSINEATLQSEDTAPIVDLHVVQVGDIRVPVQILAPAIDGELIITCAVRFGQQESTRSLVVHMITVESCAMGVSSALTRTLSC